MAKERQECPHDVMDKYVTAQKAGGYLACEKCLTDKEMSRPGLVPGWKERLKKKNLKAEQFQANLAAAGRKMQMTDPDAAPDPVAASDCLNNS